MLPPPSPFFTGRETKLLRVSPHVVDLARELGVHVVLDERVHDAEKKCADNDADDDTDGLVDIELCLCVLNGGLRLHTEFGGLTVELFLDVLEKLLHVSLPPFPGYAV